MSQSELHKIAQAETPEGVDVPNTPAGLVAWALIRFGPWVFGFILAGIFYQDFKAERAGALAYQQATSERVMIAFESQAKAGIEQASAIREMTRTLDENTDTVKRIRQ